MKNKPLVIAHRGYSAKFPENTMAAFYAAVESGAQMIELDVHLTSDGALIVTHDFILGRTCNGTGQISDKTSAELRRFDAGSWFRADFKHEQFPLLEQVLALAKDKVEINIELKEETLTSSASYEAMAEKTLDLLERYGVQAQTLISSFDWKMLATLREKDDRIRLGLLNHEPERGLRWKETELIQPYSYHPHHKFLDSSHVQEIHEKGLLLFTYTANSIQEFERLVVLGVDGIITNEVSLLKAFLDAKV